MLDTMRVAAALVAARQHADRLEIRSALEKQLRTDSPTLLLLEE